MAKIALPVLVVLAAALAGCATSGGTVTPMSTSSTPPPPAASAPDGTAAHPATWGQQYKGASLSTALGAPAPYTPSRMAFVGGAKIERAVALDITVTNGSKDQPMPSMALSIQGTSGGAQAEKIYDSGGGIDQPTADILPGKSLSWKVAFSVPKDATELTVQVSSLGGGKTVYFSGKL
jgi:hypothetical protein